MSLHTPTLIAIETSTEVASVALLHKSQITYAESQGAQTHSSKVPLMLQALLRDAGITLSACDAIAFGAGPGSFTGVRTACALAQGLAFGAGLPVVPVVTLLAMAQAARLATGADQVLALLDARMGEVYWAQYAFDGEWECISPPSLDLPEQVQVQGQVHGLVAGQGQGLGQLLVCGNGLNAQASAWPHLLGSQQRPEIMPQAAAILPLAVEAMRRGESLAARDAQPIYLRNKVALTIAERLGGSAA